MSQAIGLFLLLLGASILVLGTPVLILSLLSQRVHMRVHPRQTLKLLCVGIGLVVFGISLSGMYHHEGVRFLPVGIICFLVGLLLIGTGSWISFFAPFSKRSAKTGLVYIFCGLGVMLLGVVVMPIAGLPSFSGFGLPTVRHPTIPHRTHGQGMPFWAFAAVVLLYALGLGIKRGVRLQTLFGGLVMVVAMLVLVYALLPVFS